MYTYKAKVINVVDGDTIDCTVELGFHMTASLRLRLAGLDAPETKGPSKAAGIASRNFTAMLLLNKDVVIETYKSDSFGRWLAIICLDGDINFNEAIIRAGHAVARPGPWRMRAAQAEIFGMTDEEIT